MRLIASLVLLGLASMAQAQQYAGTSAPLNMGPPRVKLDLTVDDTMLIVETLGQISCPNVAALATCNKAAELLAEIKKQVRAQGQ